MPPCHCKLTQSFQHKSLRRVNDTLSEYSCSLNLATPIPTSRRSQAACCCAGLNSDLKIRLRAGFNRQCLEISLVALLSQCQFAFPFGLTHSLNTGSYWSCPITCSAAGRLLKKSLKVFDLARPGPVLRRADPIEASRILRPLWVAEVDRTISENASQQRSPCRIDWI